MISRVGHGVYRFSGAQEDPLAEIRIAWLRLSPECTPTERIVSPKIWVSQYSALRVHLSQNILQFRKNREATWQVAGGIPSFIVTVRVQCSTVTVSRRTVGLAAHEWTVKSGLVVTSIPRTVQDLLRSGVTRDGLVDFAVTSLVARAMSAEEAAEAFGLSAQELNAWLGPAYTRALASTRSQRLKVR